MVRAQTLRARGYLIPVLSICVTILTLGFLSLSAYTARVEDRVEERRARLSSFYAAESGLLLAQHSLIGKAAPPQGVWLAGELSMSFSRYRVEVLPADYGPNGFTVRAVGQSVGEQGALVLVELVARLEKVPGDGWKVVWRTRH